MAGQLTDMKFSDFAWLPGHSHAWPLRQALAVVLTPEGLPDPSPPSPQEPTSHHFPASHFIEQFSEAWASG